MTPSTPRPRCRPITSLLAALLLALGLAVGAADAASAQDAPGSQPTSSSQTWSLKPATPSGPDDRAHFVHSVTPGQTISDTLAVTNYGDGPLRLDLYANDAFTTDDGGFDLLPRAEAPVELGTWVVLGSTTVELAPRETVLVPVELRVPTNASPGDHAGGIVAALVSTTTDASGQQVAVEHRVGARVYLRVDGPVEPSLEVTDLRSEYHGTLNPASPGRADVTFTVTNTGNVRLSGRQTVAVTGPAGRELGQVVLPDLPELLPGASIEQTARLDGIWPALRLWTHVDIQPVDVSSQLALEPVEATTAQWVVPWTQLLIALVVVGLVVALVLRRRGRRPPVPGAPGPGVAPSPESAASTTAPEATGVDALT